MENKLYRWVKASERPMPMSDDSEKIFCAIIENEKRQMTSCVVWHLGEDTYKNIYTGYYYEVPKEKISWLEPLPEINQEEQDKTWKEFFFLCNAHIEPKEIEVQKTKYILIKR